MSQTLEASVDAPPMARRSVIRAQIQRLSIGTAAHVQGVAVGLTDSTAEIALDVELAVGEEVGVIFHNADRDVQLSTAAEVRKVRSTSAGKWAVSLSFDPALSRSDLDRLVPDNRIERRASPRQPIIGHALVDWGDGAPLVPVQLKDISGGGFCMIAAEPAIMNKRLHLILETARQKRFVIPARSRWQVKSDVGYSIGCEFLYSQGYHLMHAIFATPPSRPRWESFVSFQCIITLLGLLCSGVCAYHLLAY